MNRILVVDDEPQILRVLRAPLHTSGYQVLTAANGVEAMAHVRSTPPSLVITDLSMPEMNGLELTKAIREISAVPIIVLSVRESSGMKVEALDAGADDYLTKPFSVPELMARVRAQLRRTPPAQDDPAQLRIGDFVIDADAHTVTVRGVNVHLTPKEFDLLIALAGKPDRALTHTKLLHQVWGAYTDYQPENLRVLVASLRRKIEPEGSPRYIENEPWVGYRFRPSGNLVE